MIKRKILKSQSKTCSKLLKKCTEEGYYFKFIVALEIISCVIFKKNEKGDINQLYTFLTNDILGLFLAINLMW